MCKKSAWKRHKASNAVKWFLKIPTLLPSFCSFWFPEALLFSFSVWPFGIFLHPSLPTSDLFRGTQMVCLIAGSGEKRLAMLIVQVFFLFLGETASGWSGSIPVAETCCRNPRSLHQCRALARLGSLRIHSALGSHFRGEGGLANFWERPVTFLPSSHFAMWELSDLSEINWPLNW